LKSALGSLPREAWELVRSWWRVDRIRVSPREGRLLSLEPPCVVFITSRPAQVVERIAPDPTASDPSVTYRCRTSTGPAELCVRLTGPRELHITWRESNRERAIPESEVTL
jgi:hypothetical protein